MAYASTSDVGILCRNLLGSASDFGSSTSPTDTAVTSWLSSGCAIINSKLASRGYGAIPTTSGAYDMVKQANALWAAGMAEDSRINARITADERTRGEMFLKQFDKLLDRIVGMDLGRMGVTQTSKIYAGGISKSDKESVQADGDRVAGRFARGIFSNPEALTPTSSAS